MRLRRFPKHSRRKCGSTHLHRNGGGSAALDANCGTTHLHRNAAPDANCGTTHLHGNAALDANFLEGRKEGGITTEVPIRNKQVGFLRIAAVKVSAHWSIQGPS
jgi:hypothetical protein